MRFLLALAFIFVTGVSMFPVNFPSFLFCSSVEGLYPTVSTCQYRSGLKEKFQSCPNYALTEITVISDTTEKEYCVQFNYNSSRLSAKDPGSIWTLQFPNQTVEHVALQLKTDNSVDGYTELIYVYGESALITIDGFNSNFGLYSSKLHTHPRPLPAIQNIWITIDAMFTQM